ncbi:MAG TPA: hypothetical protein VGM86_12615 [Thermoanaerobaculia bacterium]
MLESKDKNPEAREGGIDRRGDRREELGLALLVAAGLGLRLAFVTVFPTLPFSDFRGLLDFALRMRDLSPTAGGFYWDYFNPGLPLILSLILRAFPAAPETAARLSTAVATGLLPVFPYLLWRGVQPRWVRLLAGWTLALWPGQIAFSGVVAQDNWVLVPVVALGALAVRSLTGRERHPVAAGLLYALGVAFRQEMLVALLPLLLGAALGAPGAPGENGRRRWRGALLLCLLAAGVPLLLLALQRRAATGRFALTSEHGGMAVLGSYVPGATANAWGNPIAYIAAVEPSLLEDPAEMRRQGVRLALREALARPAFHAARITAFTLDFAVSAESSNLFWSLVAPEVLPPAARPRAAAFSRVAYDVLHFEMAALLALFLAALLLARRSPAVWLLAAAIALKVGIHAVTVAQGRYFLAATALQILVIALGAREAAGRPSRRPAAAALALGGAVAAGVLGLGPRAVARVKAADVDPPRTYRFSLSPFPREPRILDCKIERGRLVDASETGATLETFDPHPSPGEKAVADCVFRAAVPASPLVIRLLDPYAPGGSPGRMVQRALVDGREVLVHDVAAEPGSGWTEIPLGTLPPGRRTAIRIELVAVQPDPGIPWGRQASTSFELAHAQERR